MRQDIVTIFALLAGDFDIDNKRPDVTKKVKLSPTEAILKWVSDGATRGNHWMS